MRALLMQKIISDRLNFNDNARIFVLLLLQNRYYIGGNVLLYSYGIETDMGIDLLLNFFRRHIQKF